jgi:hypothetical protein
MNKLESLQDLPPFDRLNYFYGQMLGAPQLRAEQSYFRDKMRLHNRCLHGWGTVCGLEVSVADGTTATTTGPGAGTPPTHALPFGPGVGGPPAPTGAAGDAASTWLQIGSGVGLDPLGNDLVLRHPCSFDPWQALSAADRAKIEQSPETVQTLYVSLCYCEIPIDPMRPVLPDACGAAEGSVNGKVRDSVCAVVTLDEPKDDPCGTCCAAPPSACLLLARVRGYQRGKALTKDQVKNWPRRMAGVYPSVTIDAVGWRHGGRYKAASAVDLLKNKLQVNFSRPVRTSTLTLVDGVVDVWLIQSGSHAAGPPGAVVALPGTLVPAASAGQEGFADGFTYKVDVPAERAPVDNDRVLVIVRAPFILDACCRPVDGAHVGGRVPAIGADPAAVWPECASPPTHPGPWTSGTGAPGASFESWFFVDPGGV